MQGSFEHLDIHYIYRSRPFFCAYSEWFPLYECFSPNISLSLTPSDFNFSMSFNLFLGGIYA